MPTPQASITSGMAALDIESGVALKKQTTSGLERSSGLRITFRDLSYEVNSSVEKGKKLKLLDSVSAYAEPYQMTALMGPSGSGKTTLLDVLAGRKTTGTITGDVRFGGSTPSPAFLRRYTGYVEQFDTLVGSLTVTEMLMYTAELKRSIMEPYSSKQEAVRLLIERLGLTVCADVAIGDPLTKGISGGQAKRTNIGIALISEPRVLFLDEPTSGLDSYSANEVVSLVQGLAREGTTVVATIHSPSAVAFAMFDRVLLLAKGYTAYFGPQGDAALVYAKQHWPGAGSHHIECSNAEFLVDVVTEADRSGQALALADAYKNSKLKKENDAQLDLYMATSGRGPVKRNKSQSNLSKTSAVPAVHADGEASSSHSSVTGYNVVSHPSDSNLNAPDAELAAQLATRQSTSTPWYWALLTLIKYRSRVNYKNPAWVMPRLADKFMFAFVILTLYLKTGDQFDQNNIVNLCASLFMWCTLPAFGAVAYVPSIVLERKLFYRERADGLYYVGTYLAAKLIEELVLATFISIAFSAFVFYGVQYQGSFVLFWLVYLLTLANGIAVGYLMAAIAPNMDVANAALPAYVTTLLFFAGQLATYDSIPVYWQWYSRIDFIRYAWSSLMLNQFADNNPIFTNDGVKVLDYYGMSGGNMWQFWSYLFAFFAVYTTLAYLALSFIKHSKR